MNGINAIGTIIGNPDEIIFVLTKSDVERVYNMTHRSPLGTALPDSVWSAFKQNMYHLDDRLDHAAAIEDILTDYCQIVPTIAPPPPIRIPVNPMSPVTPVCPLPVAPVMSAPPAPPAPPAPHAPAPAEDYYKDYHKLQRKKYNTQKFYPPGYGNHVVWSAHRVRAFMLALKKPTVYDANLRTLAQIAGVHPYDFRWQTNPVSFGRKNGLSDAKMKQMMGNSYDVMVNRFTVKSWD